jgi:hypothetical protein
LKGFWLHQSPNMTLMDFFPWGLLKERRVSWKQTMHCWWPEHKHYQQKCCNPACKIFTHGVLWWAVFPRGGKSISISSATQLSPHIPWYVLHKFLFHQ